MRNWISIGLLSMIFSVTSADDLWAQGGSGAPPNAAESASVARARDGGLGWVGLAGLLGLLGLIRRGGDR